jgi:hypothetical protein
MRTINTMHVKYVIDSQPMMVHTYQVWEKAADAKGHSLFCVSDKFFIYKRGEPVGDGPVFETDDFGAMIVFIDTAI